MHARCGCNRAISVSVPPEPRVIGSPSLPSILPYCRSSGVHARRRVVYYSRCSLYIPLHASHTLDRVPRPLIRNGHRSRPIVPHHLHFAKFNPLRGDSNACGLQPAMGFDQTRNSISSLRDQHFPHLHLGWPHSFTSASPLPVSSGGRATYPGRTCTLGRTNPPPSASTLHPTGARRFA